MSTPDGATEASASEYSVDEDNQLQPEDTLVDRGVDDVLYEGYSPPERPYGRGSFGSTPENFQIIDLPCCGTTLFRVTKFWHAQYPSADTVRAGDV